MKIQTIAFASLGTLLIFLLKENRTIKALLSNILHSKENTRLKNSIRTIMEEENVSYEEAKEILLTREIIKALSITKKQWVINSDIVLNQGDRVSFVDKEVGFVQGDFLGLIEPEIAGYDDLYVLRNAKDSKIRQASISYVKEDTVNVYK